MRGTIGRCFASAPCSCFCRLPLRLDFWGCGMNASTTPATTRRLSVLPVSFCCASMVPTGLCSWCADSWLPVKCRPDYVLCAATIFAPAPTRVRSAGRSRCTNNLRSAHLIADCVRRYGFFVQSPCCRGFRCRIRVGVVRKAPISGVSTRWLRFPRGQRWRGGIERSRSHGISLVSRKGSVGRAGGL